jgi:hypothetical protein
MSLPKRCQGAGIDIRRLREFCFSQRATSLYKAFQETFGGLWERYFEDSLRQRISSVYDLVTEILLSSGCLKICRRKRRPSSRSSSGEEF